MAYEALKLASSRNGDLAKLRTSALKQAASGARFADSIYGSRSIQALRDMADAAALAGDDDLCVAIKTSLRGGELSPAQFRTMMAAAKKAPGAQAKTGAIPAKSRASASTAKSGAPVRPGVSAPSPGLTGADLQRSADRARKAERDRWAGVMLDPAVKGKECDAAKILAGTDQAPKAILAFLADPDGVKAAAVDHRTKSAKAGEAWDAAIASVFPGQQVQAGHAQGAAQPSDGVWDRAIASVYPNNGDHHAR